MNPLGDFEGSNARAWEEDSTADSLPPRPTNLPTRSKAGQEASTASSLPPRPTNTPTRSKVGQGSSSGQLKTPVQSGSNRKYHPDTRHAGGSAIRGFERADPSAHLGPPNQNIDPNSGKASRISPGQGYQPPHHGAGRERRNAGAGMPNPRPTPDTRQNPWARPQKLVTARMTNLAAEQQREKEQTERYFRPVEGETDYPATAYYLWPKKDTKPRELLGWKLERLDILRTTHKVLIEWDDKKHCLTINSERASSDAAMMATIKGIRQVVQSSEAEVVYASPQYIVTPPTASAMRVIVQPKYDGDKNIIGVELGGRQFSTLEQDIWSSNRDEMISKNLTKLQGHLVKHITLLAPLMDWMRMRLHFGHARLGKVREEFVNSKYTLEDFTKMMAHSRVRTSGKFDRKLDDPALASSMLRKIVESPHRFCPVQARIAGLEDVQPKHTGILFVKIPDGENLRIEAEVDNTLQNGLGKYQIGSTRVFRDNRRNKRVEVTTLDIESEFDWTLEIITDGSINEFPDQLRGLIDGSLSGNSKERKDCLGLSYPGVSPRFTYGLDVVTVVVRSVYQYLLKDSGYIVEIAVYREWNGYNTKAQPKMLSGVSMFHPVWDAEMGSIENTTFSRNWDPQLNCFFRQGQNGGIQKFLEDVVLIQGLLSDAARAAKEHSGVLCQFEGMDEPVGRN